MVRVLDSGSSGPGSGPGWGHCVVFLGKTLHAYETGDKCRPDRAFWLVSSEFTFFFTYSTMGKKIWFW